MDWKGIIVVIVGLMAWACVASAGTAITVAGNDDHIDLRYGHVAGKGEIGGYVSYGDSIIAQGGWTAGGGVYGTWDVWSHPASIIGYEIDAALYVGGIAGLLNQDDEPEERGRRTVPTVSLIGGTRIGDVDKGIFLAIEGRYGFKSADWSALADIEQRREATLNIGYRF